MRYVVCCEWEHIWSSGEHGFVRWAYDTLEQRMVAVQMECDNGEWTDAPEEAFEDVTQSVLYANEDCLENPDAAELGTVATDTLPVWA